MKGEWVRLLDAVIAEAKTVDSRFRDTKSGQNALWEFLDVNNWFGIRHEGTGQDVRVPSIAPMKEALDLWLRAYRKSGAEKIDLMLEAYKSRFPQTCRLFQQFLQDTRCKNRLCALNLLDFILSALDKEITAYDEAGIRDFILRGNQSLSISEMRQFVAFLNAAGHERWDYEFQSRRIVKPENGAYSLEQFSILAYTVFNEESWREHSLIEKAVKKRKYAELWLFVALHFVCAIRKSDLTRFPVPSLPYAPKEVRENILRGNFSRADARAVSEELLFRLEMNPLRPGKTGRYGNVSNLKLFIPESVLEPMGVILSLSLSWREPSDPFVSTNAEISNIRAFFGAEFAAAVGDKRFLSRRANKAYLQGIELAADDTGGAKPKGYILAALARSHKGGIARLPEMTDIYLRDANFSGYRPEFILREMFERGILGFIPALLLESYLGRDYRKLDVASQTQLIKAIGLDARQLEALTEAVMKSYRQADEIVRSLLAERCGQPRRLESVLQNIAAGASPSKQPEFLCLRSAAGYPCCMADRTGCIGCAYEIYTKSAMRLLAREYTRLNHAMTKLEGLARNRMKGILEQGVLPSVAEMLCSIPMLYPDSDMEPLYEIMERGIQNAGSPSG